MTLSFIRRDLLLNSSILVRLAQNALRGKCIIRKKYCNRNILKLSEREVFEDIFPDKASNEIVPILSHQPQHVYAGFDPTAESLHIGNLLILINLLHWQRAGHHVIALIGNATAQIGDPSGRVSDREEQFAEVVRENGRQIQKNIERVFSNHEKYFWSKIKNGSPLPPVRFLDNEEWYSNANVITFLSKIGRHFRIGAMLLKDSVKLRMEGRGLNYTEFSYQIFQAHDWLHLFKTYGCRFQIGGKDQMGNIVAGHQLISRVLNEPVYGLTLPLVTTDAGDKFGKSLPNAVWLDESLTSPFEFYQFFIRREDNKVEQLLKLFTFMPLEEITSIMSKQLRNPEQRIAQTRLAEEVTLLVHGEEGLKSAQTSSSILYGKSLDALSEISFEDLTKVLKGVTIVTLPWKIGYTILQFALDIPCFFTSVDALRLMDAGAFYINLQKVKNPYEVMSRSVHMLPNNTTVVRVGKKTYWIVKWEI